MLWLWLVVFVILLTLMVEGGTTSTAADEAPGSREEKGRGTQQQHQQQHQQQQQQQQQQHESRYTRPRGQTELDRERESRGVRHQQPQRRERSSWQDPRATLEPTSRDVPPINLGRSLSPSTSSSSSSSSSSLDKAGQENASERDGRRRSAFVDHNREFTPPPAAALTTTTPTTRVTGKPTESLTGAKVSKTNNNNNNNNNDDDDDDDEIDTMTAARLTAEIERLKSDLTRTREHLSWLKNDLAARNRREEQGRLTVGTRFLNDTSHTRPGEIAQVLPFHEHVVFVQNLVLASASLRAPARQAGGCDTFFPLERYDRFSYFGVAAERKKNHICFGVVLSTCFGFRYIEHGITSEEFAGQHYGCVWVYGSVVDSASTRNVLFGSVWLRPCFAAEQTDTESTEFAAKIFKKLGDLVRTKITIDVYVFGGSFGMNRTAVRQILDGQFATAFSLSDCMATHRRREDEIYQSFSHDYIAVSRVQLVGQPQNVCFHDCSHNWLLNSQLDMPAPNSANYMFNSNYVIG